MILSCQYSHQQSGTSLVWIHGTSFLTTNLSRELLPEADGIGLIFIETSWKAKQLPYHKQKLALLLSNQRHFALEMQDAGYPVRYVFSEKEYGEVLAELCEELGEITVTKPAELSLRRSIQPLVEAGQLTVLEHKGLAYYN